MGGGVSAFTLKDDVIGQDAEAMKVFQLLELTQDDLNKLYTLFKKLDKRKLERVTIESVLKHIGVQKSKLSTRIVRSADVDHDGRLNFKEFVLNCWTFATKDIEGVCGYAFDNFDKDGSGELSIDEVRDMVRDVHFGYQTEQEMTITKVTSEVDQLLKVMDTDGRSQRISKQEFLGHCLEFRQLLNPALLIQQRINENIIGPSFWLNKSKEAGR